MEQLKDIDYAILKIVLSFKNTPVGFQVIDRRLLLEFTDFVLSGELGKKLEELKKASLIKNNSPNGGYLLTPLGMEILGEL